MRRSIASKFYEHKLLTFCHIISLFAFGFSLYAEYILGKSACKLCLFQRWPYAITGLLSLLGIFSRYTTLAVYALLGIFLFELGISTYHLLVQYGLVSDPCSVPIITNSEEFWRVLNEPIPCSKVTWKFLGIPAAGYNVLVSLNLIVLLTGWFFKTEKLRRPVFHLR